MDVNVNPMFHYRDYPFCAAGPQFQLQAIHWYSIYYSSLGGQTKMAQLLTSNKFWSALHSHMKLDTTLFQRVFNRNKNFWTILKTIMTDALGCFRRALKY